MAKFCLLDSRRIRAQVGLQDRGLALDVIKSKRPFEAEWPKDVIEENTPSIELILTQFQQDETRESNTTLHPIGYVDLLELLIRTGSSPLKEGLPVLLRCHQCLHSEAPFRKGS